LLLFYCFRQNENGKGLLFDSRVEVFIFIPHHGESETYIQKILCALRLP
jgi:hypothetical protein